MATSARTVNASLHVFLEKIIDYAGLFAPASLDMLTSVDNYSRYLDDARCWTLGRFVLPVARLDEFLDARKNAGGAPWLLSGIVSGSNIESDAAAVVEFNRKAQGVVIDTLEVRVGSLGEIEKMHTHQPAGTTVFYEISPQHADEFLRILKRVGGCAKLRTGGVDEAAIPAYEQVSGFIARCAELGIPFKATAGLHHPLRCASPLNSESNPVDLMTYGFLNIFTAAAIAWTSVSNGDTVPRFALATCLADGERSNWHFDDDALTWSGDVEPIRINAEGIRAMRSKFAISFGSCSFEEPLGELYEFDLL